MVIVSRWEVVHRGARGTQRGVENVMVGGHVV